MEMSSRVCHEVLIISFAVRAGGEGRVWSWVASGDNGRTGAWFSDLSRFFIVSEVADVDGVGRREAVESPGCVVGQRGEVVPGSSWTNAFGLVPAAMRASDSRLRSK